MTVCVDVLSITVDLFWHEKSCRRRLRVRHGRRNALCDEGADVCFPRMNGCIKPMSRTNFGEVPDIQASSSKAKISRFREPGECSF